MTTRTFRVLTIIMILYSIGGCKVQKVSTLTASSSSLVVGGAEWATAWQQRSGEYKALCFQAYNLAKLRLDLLLQQEHTKPLAIVTDIDETVLDNSPYTIHRIRNDKPYNDTAWMEWTVRAEADTVPGALSFFKYAKSKNVSIFYITNRLEAEREATLKNLGKWGFPDIGPDHLLLKKETSGKEARRQLVLKDHEIALLVGDNLSDFNMVFDKKPFEERNAAVKTNADAFGSKFIVLPNPMYGDWEPALYQFKYQLPNSSKDSAIRKALIDY